MQITRAKATALLNKGEMTLYDESRHNAIRGFTASQLETRIDRARKARDRSRDLLRRQKVSSRAATGSKGGTSGVANQRSADKAEIIDDILKRFESRLKEAEQLEKDEAAGARKAAGKTAKKAASKTAKKAASKTAKKAASKTTSRTAKKAAGPAVKKAAGATARKTAGKSASRKSAAKKVTPKQALRSTRKLLEAKQEEARQPKPWEDATAHGGQVEGDGFQSTEAARRAEELHAAGSRIPAIHGSAGTRGRINQGKRDSKGGG